MPDGSDIDIEPGFSIRFADDLFPSRFPDFVSAGITDAEAIHAVILEGRNPSGITAAPGAGEEGIQKDSGLSFVRLSPSSRTVTPESGFDATVIGYRFTEVDE